ncbi:MAG: diaminopimelate decarboxylase [Planctomycetia bacterium]
MTRPIALTDALLRDCAERHGTPVWVYDAATIAARVAELRAFDRVRYAQKANGNLAVLALLRELGVEVDAVSAGEVARAIAAGHAPESIVYTADLFDDAALEVVRTLPVQVNLGSDFMLAQLARARRGARATVRVNPGFGHGHARKTNTGGESSKHGVWHEDLPRMVDEARRLGVVLDGLHVHIGSGSDFDHLTRVCTAVRALASVFGPDLRRVSAGGGLPIAYKRDEGDFDVARYCQAWLEAKRSIEGDLGHPIELEVEPGRRLVAEAGVLVARVRGVKRQGAQEYVMVDAGFNALLRPAMYGSWHELEVLGAPESAPRAPRLVAGPLCESGDMWTQGPGGGIEPRLLPAAREGDLLVVHDAGAYGASMSSTYNGHPLAPEVLVRDGVARLVRRRQAIDELLAQERGLDR